MVSGVVDSPSSRTGSAGADGDSRSHSPLQSIYIPGGGQAGRGEFVTGQHEEELELLVGY